MTEQLKVVVTATRPDGTVEEIEGVASRTELGNAEGAWTSTVRWSRPPTKRVTAEVVTDVPVDV